MPLRLRLVVAILPLRLGYVVVMYGTIYGFLYYGGLLLKSMKSLCFNLKNCKP